MGTFWNYIQQRPQVIVVAIFVLISFISWVTRAVEAQRKRRQAALDRERTELEGLRTGQTEAPRPAPVQPQRHAAASAQASLEEIAARRRAAMEQLQRRSAGFPAAPSAPPRPQSAAQREVARVLGQVLGVPGANLPRPTARPAQPQRPLPPRPAQRTQPTPPPRPATRPPSRPNVESDKAYAVTIPKASQHTTGPGASPGSPRSQGTPPRPAGRATPDAAAAYAVNIPQASQSGGRRAPPAAVPIARAQGAGWAISPSDLKRSIVMREVLSPPVSLRDPGADQVA